MDALTQQSVKSATLEATIIRADGRREPLGLVASYHRNPLVRAWRWARNPRLRGGKGKFSALPGEGGLRVLTRTAFDRFLFRLKGRWSALRS